jgi:hypothetical protein
LQFLDYFGLFFDSGQILANKAFIPQLMPLKQVVAFPGPEKQVALLRQLLDFLALIQQLNKPFSDIPDNLI